MWSEVALSELKKNYGNLVPPQVQFVIQPTATSSPLQEAKSQTWWKLWDDPPSMLLDSISEPSTSSGTTTKDEDTFSKLTQLLESKAQQFPLTPMHSEPSIKLPKHREYGEIPQSYNVRFAWAIQTAENTFRAMHGWARCRDFLGDYILAHTINNYAGTTIYGFRTYKGTRLTNLLAINFPDESFTKLFQSGLRHIQALEKYNGIQPTEIVAIGGTKSVIKVPDFWLSSNILLSLYTFLLKVFSFSDKNPFEKCDSTTAQYVLSTEKYLSKLLQNLTKIKYPTFLEQWEKKPYIGDFHNYSGFVSYLQKNAVFNTLKTQLDKL